VTGAGWDAAPRAGSDRSMGMSTGGHREINVTPLIDVLLVLLIIFMVVMPILLRMETVQIPRSDKSVDPEVPVVVKLDADLSVHVDDGAGIPLAHLTAALRPKLALAKVVFVEFVDGVPWHDVIATVDTIRSMADDPNHDAVPIAIRMRDESP
jgi:biopolymer transport protein ExbD